MANVRRISRKYYVRQIVACFLAYCLFLNPVVLADIVLTGQETGSGITVTPGILPDTTDMTAGNNGIGYFSDFDIALGHTVTCVQGDPSYNALFKVDSADGTQIYGIFNSDGNIYLQDLRGILIGSTGIINTNSFIASTLNIKNSDWQDFVDGTISELRFERESYFDPRGTVNNEGTINAVQNVYLVGSQVLNSGIITAPDTLVMAAGDKIFLTTEGSKILIKTPETDLVTSYPAARVVDIDAASTITANQVVLAAGDIFTAALDVGSLAATANRDITLEGAITAEGHVEILGGQNSGLFSNADIYINEGITAGSMRIKNGKDAYPGEESLSGIYLADDKNLTATDGDVIIEAVHDVVLGGDVSATGDIFINGDEDGYGDPTGDNYNPNPYGGGDVWAKGELNAEGDIDIRGNDILLESAVDAGGNLTITGATSEDDSGGTLFNPDSALGDVHAVSTLNAGKNIEISATDDTIYLDADVTAGLDLVLNNNTVAAHEVDLKAGQNVDIAAGKIVTALGSLGIEATNGEIMADTSIIDMAADYKILKLTQKANMDLEQDFSVNNRTKTDLVADSTGGSVTSEAAGEWNSITAHAAENITLSDISEVITTGWLDADNGDVKVTVEDGKVYAEGFINAGRDVIITATDEGYDGTEDAIFLNGVEEGKSIVAGRDIWLNNNTLAAAGYLLDAGQDVRIGWQGEQDPWDPASGHYAPKTLTGAGGLTIEAKRHITLGGDVETVGDLILRADYDDDGEPGGDMTALGNITSTEGSIDIYASDSTIILTGDKVEASGDVTLHDNTVLNGGNQRIEATTGKLTTEGYVHKTTTGDLDMFGGYDGWLGGTDYSVWTKAVTVDDGQLTIEGNRYVRLDGSIYSSGDMKLAANSDEDSDIGYLGHFVGTIRSLTGDVDISATNHYIELHGGNVTEYVTAGEDILLHDNTRVAYDRKLAAGDDVVLAAGKELRGVGTGGRLTVEATDDIMFGVNIATHETTPTTGSGGNVSVTDGDLIVNAGGSVYAHGTLTTDPTSGGDIEVYSSDDTTYLYGDYIHADGSVLLDNTTVSYGDIIAGQDVTLNGTLELKGTGLDENQEITATNGQLHANDWVHKTSAGNLEMFGGYNGPLYPDMDYSVSTKEVRVEEGTLTIEGNASVRLHGSIYSKYDMWLTANADGVDSPDQDRLEHTLGTIESEFGDIDMSAQSDVIYLNGGQNLPDPYVSAGGDILLRDWTWVQYSNKLDAGDDIVLAAGEQIHANGSLTLVAGDDILLGVTNVDQHWDNPASGSAGDVSTKGDLIMAAGDDVYVHGSVASEGILDVYADGGDIVLKANVSSVDEMIMDAGSNIELNANSGNTSSESTITLDAGDSVTIGQAFADNGNVTANGNMDISAGTDADDNVKVFGKLTTLEGSGGNIDVTAGGDITLGGSIVDSAYESAQADGDLTLDAEDDLKVYGDLISNNGSIELSSDDSTTYLYGDVTAAVDVTLNNNTKFYGLGDQKVDAQTGTITAKGWLLKASCWGSLYLEAAGNISLADYVEAYWGGVSIISEEGKIFTPDEFGGETDTLNVWIIGYSDQLEGDGVVLDPDYPSKKAAIVIISKEDLKLGPDSALIANGYYIPLHAIDIEGIETIEDYDNFWSELYDEFGGDVSDYLEYGFEDYLESLESDGDVFEDIPLLKELLGDYLATLDDRPAICLLDEPAMIGVATRNEGVPIDVAIYLASTEGDVDVESHQVYVEPHGTMVVDAYDTVTLGDMTPEPAINTLNGTSEVTEGRSWIIDRLEVVSRITEWLFEASDYGTLPHPYNPEIVEAFIGGDYILRGAGLGNPIITDGRAWVLEDPILPPPLFREAGEESELEEFAEGGCPALMNWFASEIGVPADEIQVVVADAFALSTDIQPCEMCARLMNAATIMEDAEGARIAALNQVINEFVTTPAPPSPEQMTLIAAAFSEHVGDGTYYALAGEWIESVVAYVNIMTTEMGYSATEATAFADKYITQVTDVGNVALTAYVTSRLAALGG